MGGDDDDDDDDDDDGIAVAAKEHETVFFLFVLPLQLSTWEGRWWSFGSWSWRE